MNEQDLNPLDTLSTLHSQTDAMLLLMLVYLEQAREGGEQINSIALENYVGQMKSNMEQAERATMKLVDMKLGKP
jgi:hypothetical protein